MRSEIARLRNAYHIENAPNVTDDVYDSLNKELKSILEKYPEFDDSNSAENRVAGKALKKFEKVEHKNRMLSLNDVFSEEELETWEKRINHERHSNLISKIAACRGMLFEFYRRRYKRRFCYERTDPGCS